MLQSSRITPNTLALSFQTPPAIALFFTDNKHKKRRVRRFQIPLTGDNADDIYKSLSSSFPQYLGPSVVPVAQLTRLIQKLLNRFSVDDNSDGDNVSSVEQTSLYSAPEPLSPSPIPTLSNPNLNASSSLPPISTPSSFASSLPPLIAKPSAIIAPKLDSDSHQGSEAPEANDDELMALLSDLESRTAAPTRSRNKPGKPPAPAAAPASALSSPPAPAAATPSPAPAPSLVKDKSDEPAPKQNTPDTPQPALSSLPQPNRLSGLTLAPLSSLPPLGGRPKLGALPPLGGGLGLSKPNELPKPAAVAPPAMATEVFIPVSNPDAEDDLNRVSPRALAAKKAEMEKAFKANQVTKASSEFVYDKRADFGPAKEKSEWDDEAEDVEPVSVPVAALSVPVVPTAKPSAAKVEEPVDLDISEDLDIEVEEENEDEEQNQSISLDKKDAVESSAQKSSSSVLSSLLGAPLAEGLKVVRSSDDGFSNDSDENAENDILF